MELKEPLLVVHRAQERGAAAAALAGRQHGSVPGAALTSSDMDLAEAKGSAKKQPVRQQNRLQGDTSDDKNLEEDTPIREEGKKSDDLPIPQEDAGSKTLEDLPMPQEDAGSKTLEDLPIPQEDSRSKTLEDLPITQEDAGSKTLEDPPIHQQIGKKPQLPTGTPTLELLRKQASSLAKFAAGSSMAATAEAFSRAVDRFAAGKDRKKRVTDTEMSKSAITLFSVARGAPLSEADLASVAIKLTSDAQLCLLSDTDTDSKTGLFVRWWWRGSSTSVSEAAKQQSFKQWLRAALSASKPMLPIHAECVTFVFVLFTAVP
ncbi:unnamed protein product [Urochloa humidicola]